MPVPLLDFVGGLQRLRVFIVQADRTANLVHDILIGHGMVAAGRLLAAEVRALDVRTSPAVMSGVSVA